MEDKDKFDQESEDTSDELQHPIPKSRRSLSKVRRELSEEEFNSPAALRMLIDEVERLDEECADLIDYRERFYSAERRGAILEEKLKARIASDIIFGTCLAVGAAAIGYAPATWTQQPTGWIFLILGGLLIIGGTIARGVMK